MFLGAPAMWVDESISAIASKNILEKGVPIFDSGFFYGRALVYHYSEALSLFAFGLNDFAARLPSVIFGVLTVLLAFFVGREYSKKAGLIAALFTATFFLEVFFSMQGRFYQLFQLAFFASLFFLYKSKTNIKWIYPALFAFALAVDTNPFGLVLAPFFIIDYLFFRGKIKFNQKHPKEKSKRAMTLILREKLLFLVIPTILLAVKGIELFLSIISTFAAKEGRAPSMNFFAAFMQELNTKTFFTLPFMFVFCAAGAIWAYFKNKRLTLMLLAPSILGLFGLYVSSEYALRYFYYFVFPIMIFSGVLFGFIAENRKQFLPVLIVLVALIFAASNIFFPASFGFAIFPPQTNLEDSSAPIISFSGVPAVLYEEIKYSGTEIITLYSPPVEWYFKKPDRTIPFTLTGLHADETSILEGEKLVDIYSGSTTINNLNEIYDSYFFIEEYFASSKLGFNDKVALDTIKKKCEFRFENKSIAIFYCG